MLRCLLWFAAALLLVSLGSCLGALIGSIAMPPAYSEWLRRVLQPGVELLLACTMPFLSAMDGHASVRPFFSEETDGALGAIYWQPLRGRQLFLFRHSLPELLAWRSEVRARQLVPSPRAPARGRAASCAVVGSSGSVLDRMDGDTIDAADVVIRVNAAPTPWTLRRHVGARTTFYLNAYLPGVRSPRGRGSVSSFPGGRVGPTPVVFYCQNLWVAECWSRIAHDGAERVSPRLVADAAARLRLTAKAPTSGFVALILALHLCNHTRAYGFGGGSRCARYYGPCRNVSQYRTSGRRWHDWPREAAWIQGSGLLKS